MLCSRVAVGLCDGVRLGSGLVGNRGVENGSDDEGLRMREKGREMDVAEGVDEAIGQKVLDHAGQEGKGTFVCRSSL